MVLLDEDADRLAVQVKQVEAGGAVVETDEVPSAR
jgi:hypothetical protein